MATVRIYKVAELLGMASQEVLALLKSDHGIELKSASSTLEEVVARSFVDRVARKRNIDLPRGDMFSGKAATKGSKKAALAKKAEPPKPTVPVLGPPRLVKTIRPPTPPAEEAATGVDAATDAATPADADGTALTEPVTAEAAVERTASSPTASEAAARAAAPIEDDARVDDPAADTQTAPGRFVPPTLRLRIEEPGQTLRPPRPLAPAKRPQASQARMVKKPAATPPAGARPPCPGRGPVRPGRGPVRPVCSALDIPGRCVRRRPACLVGPGRSPPSRCVRSRRVRGCRRALRLVIVRLSANIAPDSAPSKAVAARDRLRLSRWRLARLHRSRATSRSPRA